MDAGPFVRWEVEESANKAGLRLLAKEPVDFAAGYFSYRPVMGTRRICPRTGGQHVRLPHQRVKIKHARRSVKHFRFVRRDE